jgi:hypothetical protein
MNPKDYHSIRDALVGVNKTKQVQHPNGGATGGEIFATYCCRTDHVHSVFDDGDFIVWNIHGFGQPIRQKRTPENIAAVEKFIAQTRWRETPQDLKLTPDPCGIGTNPS